jgi:hypothetical protein
MDLRATRRRASAGDVKVFVGLTRKFQRMAFGAALALVNDFHQAEDENCFAALMQRRCLVAPVGPAEL